MEDNAKVLLPKCNGKNQPWATFWPPTTSNLAGVTETKGQMLLLDGTGGSGTTAVPNAVSIPPKPKGDNSEDKKQDNKTEGKKD